MSIQAVIIDANAQGLAVHELFETEKGWQAGLCPFTATLEQYPSFPGGRFFGEGRTAYAALLNALTFANRTVSAKHIFVHAPIVFADDLEDLL